MPVDLDDNELTEADSAYHHGQADALGTHEFDPEGDSDSDPETDDTPEDEKPRKKKSKKAAKKAAKKPKKEKKPAKPKKPKREGLSAINAAAKVLEDSEEPMTCAEMVEIMAKKKLWKSPGGATPDRTLNSAILREIASCVEKEKESRFFRAGRGLFGFTGVHSPIMKESQREDETSESDESEE